MNKDYLSYSSVFYLSGEFSGAKVSLHYGNMAGNITSILDSDGNPVEYTSNTQVILDHGSSKKLLAKVEGADSNTSLYLEMLPTN